MLAIVALARIDISLPSMFESVGNAQRFFERVGGLSFPEPAKLLQLTVLTVGLVPVSYTHLDVYKRQHQVYDTPSPRR